MPLANPEQRAAYNREYYATNHARLRQQQAEYHQRELAAIRERRNRFRAANKEACAEAARQWRKNNPEKQLALSRKHYRENADKANAATNAWRKRNHDVYTTGRTKYRRERRRADPAFAMVTRLRATLWQALKKQGARKISRTIQLIGCSAPKLASYLESKFSTGMTWENRGLWHIDHIRPCVSFDLIDPEQQKACFHYTNLQPLWATENRRKGARWNG